MALVDLFMGDQGIHNQMVNILIKKNKTNSKITNKIAIRPRWTSKWHDGKNDCFYVWAISNEKLG